LLEDKVVLGHVRFPFLGGTFLFGLSEAFLAHHLLSTLHDELLLGVLVFVFDFEFGAGFASQGHLLEGAFLRVLLRLYDGLGNLFQGLFV